MRSNDDLLLGLHIAEIRRELDDASIQSTLLHGNPGFQTSVAIAIAAVDYLIRNADRDGLAAVSNAAADAEAAQLSRTNARRADEDAIAAEHSEKYRLHNEALTVECPYCGSRPKSRCISKSGGPLGGFLFHADRLRSARSILGRVSQ